jgi:DNA-binding transcriptional MocR family regulator
MRTKTLRQNEKTPLYEDVAGKITYLIEEGTFRPGNRLPSLRGLSAQLRVSINTVMEAYGLLEDRRLIEARPQSGYYVCARAPEIVGKPLKARPNIIPAKATISDLSQQVILSTQDPELLNLGCALPNPALLPVDKLSRMLASEARRFPVQSVCYQMTPGNERLRGQIARRGLIAGISVRPDEVLITSGCVEAVLLALRAVCRHGDVIAVESPIYYLFLQLTAELGLKVLEIPTTPQEGISIEALRYAIAHNRVKACLLVSNFSNPLGSQMPVERKRALVELLASHEIPLIEDDIYGDLSFSNDRPVAAKSFDRQGLVIYCSSFTKTLAPGYRVGWAIGGRFQAELERLKMMTSIATASPPQLAVAEFLANGGYDHHLRGIRRVYARQMALMADAVAQYFPPGTKVTRPAGGFILWVEMPEGADAIELYQRALAQGISIAPGPIFSLANSYRNNIRLNAAFWDAGVERGIKILGDLAGKCRMTGV